MIDVLNVCSATDSRLAGQQRTPAATTLSYPIVDTGQNTCYDNYSAISCPEPGEAFYGQDAHYAGAASQYVDNGDGTVTDLNTGLMWQQQTMGVLLSWRPALYNCENLSLADYNDWRLPNINHLKKSL